MTSKEDLIRFVSSAAALVISTGFAAAYNALQMNNVRYQRSLLPLATGMFAE